jgi:hypothetical protein
MKKTHIGSNFDDFLQEDGLLAECAAGAHRRVVTWQIEQEMKRRRISRTTLDLLFAENETLATFQLLERAALALGRKLKVELACLVGRNAGIFFVEIK